MSSGFEARPACYLVLPSLTGQHLTGRTLEQIRSNRPTFDRPICRAKQLRLCDTIRQRLGPSHYVHENFIKRRLCRLRPALCVCHLSAYRIALRSDHDKFQKTQTCFVGGSDRERRSLRHRRPDQVMPSDACLDKVHDKQSFALSSILRNKLESSIV